MQFRTAPVYPAVLFLTWVAILLGLADPPHLQSISLAVLVVLVVFLGIPHGATDLLIANHLAGGEATLRTNLAFLGAYLAAVALFAVLWWLLPGAALLLFSVLSCYHFGQSNLFYLPLSGAVRPFFYLLWGAYVLSGPILLNWGASEEIIRMIIGYEPNLGINTGSRALIAWSAVGGLNGVILAILRLRGSISARVFYQEV
ncbi:MAG TPA: Brp/Blh family beta-carotene 15,15'-dioxygenase, partial [Calditrichia bacterium]|nr:Brp/Blh family beta-carotene 15,15'-dioxygenase [Calditrichia bacterium]